jgi:hypothetical protein
MLVTSDGQDGVTCGVGVLLFPARSEWRSGFCLILRVNICLINSNKFIYVFSIALEVQIC